MFRFNLSIYKIGSPESALYSLISTIIISLMNVRDKINSIKYNARDLRSDVVAGAFNGGIFGLVYSFYFLPHDRHDEKLFVKSCRNSRAIYFLMNTVKMAAGFAIMRSTYNGLKKE